MFLIELLASKPIQVRCIMENDIVKRFEQMKNNSKKPKYTGKERRKEDDPAYFGHFCLEGLERRQTNSIFS
jgi:hypothetical protein